MAKLNSVWNYLGYTLNNFKVKLLGYRTYKALISQTDTEPPVLTVLENTLGIQIEFMYSETGRYIGTLNKDLYSDIYTTINGEKVTTVINPSSSNLVDNTMLFNVFPIYFNAIDIKSQNGGGTPVDSNLGVGFTCTLEITVYNR